MKQFIKKIIAFAMLVVVIVAGFLTLFFTLISPQFLYDYNASILDKMELLENTESPKIILVGNSNVAFGIDSELIYQELGINVVNLGLHGGLGNQFHEEMAKQNICEGDIVVLMHTDYSQDSIIQPDVAWITIENHYELWNLVDSSEVLRMIEALPSYIRTASFDFITGQGNQDLSETSVYARYSFNEYGDISFERNESLCIFSEDSFYVPDISDVGVERINELNEYCRERGAYLVIAGYPVADGEYTPPHEEIEDMWEELTERMDCAVISDIDDYFYPYEYFYDTRYHLTTEGARMRTAQLIEDLQSWMEENYETD